MEILVKMLSVAVPAGIVLILFMLVGRKHTKGMMDEQADIQRDIARHLDRIATALEQRKP